MADRLTDGIVRKITPPDTGNQITYDGEIKGFGLRTTAAGAKSFVLSYTATGRKRRITIGSFPDWTVSAAREQAKSLKREIDAGADPMAERHAERAAPTIQALADRYVAEPASPKRNSTLKEEASLLRQHILPKFGTYRVAAVNTDEIKAFHRKISASTPVRANRVLALFKAMFNRSIEWKYRTDNPCKGIKRNVEEKRERYATPEELKRLMTALAEHPNQSSANVIRLLLLTGARRGEVLKATWDQFDLTKGRWTKLASTTKQKKLHVVPLSAPARQLLAEMHARADSSALFPGWRDNAQQTDIKRFWASIRETADTSGLRMHDLRHSFASYLASSGLSLPVIGALLGHASPMTTQRYAHLLDDPLREATERVGVIVMDAAGNPKGSKRKGKPGNVVPIALAPRNAGHKKSTAKIKSA